MEWISSSNAYHADGPACV